MLEADKGSREKAPSPEALLDIFVHACSAVPLQPCCPAQKHKCAPVADAEHWKSQLPFRHPICLGSGAQPGASGSGHRAARESTHSGTAKGNLQQSCWEQIRRRKYSGRLMKRLQPPFAGQHEISHGTNLLKSFSSASLYSAKGWSQAPGKGGYTHTSPGKARQKEMPDSKRLMPGGFDLCLVPESCF